MSEPTTPRPAPEAVEAAIKIAFLGPKRDLSWSRAMCEFTRIHQWDEPTAADTEAARILAAEIEWLRHEAESRCGECKAKLQ